MIIRLPGVCKWCRAAVVWNGALWMNRDDNLWPHVLTCKAVSHQPVRVA